MLSVAEDTRVIELPTGRLDIAIEEAVWPLDRLCAFAARENPRRGFLVVSRVLGRHLPTPPQVIRALENLKLAVRMRLGRAPLNDDQANAFAAVLDAAAQNIDKV